jgi:glycosyltransferase involved in cell wall biosynthesis
MKLKNPNLKLIWHNHYGNSLNLPILKKIPLQVLSKSFDAIISVNNVLNSWALNFLKISNSFNLPNFAVFNHNEKQTTFLSGVENKRIVCLANLRPEKDHLNLLKAFNRIQSTYPDWTLHLIGEAIIDGYVQEIKSFITSHNLSNHVFLYGSRNDVEFILSQATIGVLASNSEGLPVSLLEYGLAKLPTVVTDVGECSQVVTHNTSGIIVPSQNEKVLAAGLTTFIENEHKRKLFGVALFKKVNENYSKTNFIKTLLNIYTS